MRRFKMNVTKLLDHFRTEVRVWNIDKKPSGENDYWLGEPVDSRNWIKSVEPEIRYEPVVPYHSSYQKYATSEIITAGGAEEEYDLSFYSKLKLGKGSIVEVKSQSKNKFRVVSLGNYHDFGGFTVYQLKGDEQHENG